MTAAVDEKIKSKAAIFADEAEALGWEVERRKLPDHARQVIASRVGELYELTWVRNERGNLVFGSGSYLTVDASDPEPVTNVKAALRDMSLKRAANGALLPFDPEYDDDAEVIAALAGHRIVWQNSITGADESGVVPRGGVHMKLAQGPKGDNGGARILTFTDASGVTGFRSVYIDQITTVN